MRFGKEIQKVPLSKLTSIDKALRHLRKDLILRKIIKEYQLQELDRESDLFQDLIESIINQQLSGKAAATIFNRFKILFGNKFPAPAQILKMPDEKIRACGISYPKIKYIKGLCQAIVDKNLDIEKIPTLKDEEVIIELTKIKGIGRWTAEMILIFSLKRLDVFSIGDLGLRTAVSRFYKIERENLKEIEKVSLKWSPFRSLAARYLWRSLDNK